MSSKHDASFTSQYLATPIFPSESASRAVMSLERITPNWATVAARKLVDSNVANVASSNAILPLNLLAIKLRKVSVDASVSTSFVSSPRKSIV